MAGIYIHIPFCRQACHYCDFHFSTNISRKTEMVNAILDEISLQNNYLEGEIIRTIYFGGGTPSLLNSNEIEHLIKGIQSNFNISSDPEITLEANPDDLSTTKLSELNNAGINRLSIGVQSFYESHLSYLNRVHSRMEALDCIAKAQNKGFKNISIDLIYGIPHQDHSIWEKDLKTTIELEVPHISSYCLTIEEKTVFGNWLRKGIIKQVEDDYAAEQHEIMVDTFEHAGYEHYEVSNFSKPGMHSRHNSSYWKREKYLGVGPGAHSFNGRTRQYNIANNSIYLKSLKENRVPFSLEELTRVDAINEEILTRMRTKWGLGISYLKDKYNYDIMSDKKAMVDEMLGKDLIFKKDNILYLTKSGKLLADHIASELFIDDEN